MENLKNNNSLIVADVYHDAIDFSLIGTNKKPQAHYYKFSPESQ